MATWFWVLYWVAVVLVIVVCIKGDSQAEEPGVFDWIKRFFVVQLFELFRAGVHRVAPGLAAKMTSCEDLFFNRPTRIFASIYWVLFMGGYMLFAQHGLPRPLIMEHRHRFEHIPNLYFSWWHKYAGSLWVFLSWAQFIHIMHSDPGLINHANIKEKADDYEYDYLFYSPKKCTTCSISRPARTKHCKVCDICVSRFDHHCIWINSCVGEGNHRAFLFFLGNHAALMLYIASAGITIACSCVRELDLMAAYYINDQDERVPASYTMIFQYVLRVHPVVVATAIFVALLSTLFVGFLAFQSYLVTMNTTTNEFFKWNDMVAYAKQEGHSEWIPKKNPYDVGIVANWIEVLLPHRPKRSAAQVLKQSEVFCSQTQDGEDGEEDTDAHETPAATSAAAAAESKRQGSGAVACKHERKGKKKAQ